MLKKIGYQAQISSDPRIIKSADKLILPGVGAFDNEMENFKKK
jgi:imidazole glycerol-phosphate synthase subunit HisH